MSFGPICAELERALQAHIWFPTLATALLLPDAAGVVDGLEARPSDRYVRWYDENVYPIYSVDDIRFDGEVVYRFRNSIIHEVAAFTRDTFGYDRIIFLPPTAPGLMSFVISRNNGGVEETALIMDLRSFVFAVLSAISGWEAKVVAEEDDGRRNRLKRLTHLHPHGIFPHGYGFPMVG